MKRATAAVLFVTALAASGNGCTRAPSDGNARLSAHMVVYLKCDKRYVTEIEAATVRTMERHKLRALNRGSLMRERFRSGEYGAQVIGLERQGGYIVSLRENIPPDNNYSVALYTEPPTRPSPEAETMVGSLVRKITRDLPCSTVSVEKHENGPKSLGTYQEALKTYEGWFEQVQRTQVRSMPNQTMEPTR